MFVLVWEVEYFTSTMSRMTQISLRLAIEVIDVKMTKMHDIIPPTTNPINTSFPALTTKMIRNYIQIISRIYIYILSFQEVIILPYLKNQKNSVQSS